MILLKWLANQWLIRFMFRICSFILICKNWIMDCFWHIHSPLLISDWCAKIYQHGDSDAYSGWEKVIQETSNLDLTNENDQTSSVRVKPGCTLNLFRNYNNGELLGSLTADVSALSAYNDQVSSLSCTCQGIITTHLEPSLRPY